MHYFIRASDVRPVTAFPAEAAGYRRFSLSDRECGAVHTGWGLCELDAKGHVNEHLQSFEKSFYVLEGNPVLVLDQRAYRLAPGACGLIPVGMKQAWLGPDSGTAKWIDMNTPVPKGVNFADDTYFLGPPPQVSIEALDVRDLTSRHLFRMSDDDIKVDALRMGLKKDAPKVSASMATALLVYSGISLKMLVDQRLDAALHTMFMVEYEPGGNAHPHDHPLEEAYYVVDGEVEAWADDQKYLMKAGDFMWAGVGCTHAFYNRSNTTVRWLETQSPQPPARNSYRFSRDWEYFAEQLKNKKAAGGARTEGDPLMTEKPSERLSEKPTDKLDVRVLIVGGTGGIGRALAERYASLGSDVILTSRDAGRAAASAVEIGPNVRGIALDIAEPEKIAGMLADVGNIDRLLIVAIERDSNTVRNYDIAKARRAVTVKLVGYTEVVHTMLDRMNEDASVVIFGGLAGQRPYPGSTTVTMVNGAVTAMVKTMAVELAPIRFNAIHPGIIGDTPAWKDKPEALAAVRARTPGGRLATTEDVVDAVKFLFNNKGVNGVNLVVDGGWILQ